MLLLEAMALNITRLLDWGFYSVDSKVSVSHVYFSFWLTRASNQRPILTAVRGALVCTTAIQCSISHSVIRQPARKLTYPLHPSKEEAEKQLATAS